MHTGASLQRLLHSDEKGTLASTLVCRHSTQVQLPKFSVVRGTQRTNFVRPRQAQRAHFGVLWNVRAIPVFRMNLHSIRISTTNVVQTNRGWEGRKTELSGVPSGQSPGGLPLRHRHLVLRERVDRKFSVDLNSFIRANTTSPPATRERRAIRQLVFQQGEGALVVSTGLVASTPWFGGALLLIGSARFAHYVTRQRCRALSSSVILTTEKSKTFARNRRISKGKARGVLTKFCLRCSPLRSYGRARSLYLTTRLCTDQSS